MVCFVLIDVTDDDVTDEKTKKPINQSELSADMGKDSDNDWILNLEWNELLASLNVSRAGDEETDPDYDAGISVDEESM